MSRTQLLAVSVVWVSAFTLGRWTTHEGANLHATCKVDLEREQRNRQLVQNKFEHSASQHLSLKRVHAASEQRYSQIALSVDHELTAALIFRHCRCQVQ